MKRQTLMIIGIIAVGSLLGSVYATSTVITDNGITTSNLTVTGTCTGCGGSGSFTTWNLLYNVTLTQTDYPTGFDIDNNGNSVLQYNQATGFVSKNGTELVKVATNQISNSGMKLVDQSANGKYQIYFDGVNHQIHILQNATLVHIIQLNMPGDFNTGSDILSISISPSGEYIGVTGLNHARTFDRLQLFEGS